MIDISKYEGNDALHSKADRLVKALTPSNETKAAYMGMFTFRIVDVNDYDVETVGMVTVPWATIKEIMETIKRQALDGII